MPDYFALSELRALPDMDNTAKYPNAAVERSAGYIVGVIEREVRTSFVLREHTERHSGGRSKILLHQTHPQRLLTVTLGGVDVTASSTLEDGVLLRLSGAWPAGQGNIEVKYLAGYSERPPDDVKEQALNGTRGHLMANSPTSSMDARRTSMSTDMGVINFVTADKDHPTGYPEVDAMIVGWRERLDVFGFA